jgi:RNA polymerase sigma factor (sigma-70 family)
MENELNTKIENALNNKDILKIMNKASKRFRNTLDGDAIYTCQINALWKAFLHFKPEKKAKFTTYLYQGVFIECLKEVKFVNKSKSPHKLHENMSSYQNTTIMVDLLDELKNEEDREIIMDRISRMTINEIAQKKNVSRETIRKKIKKILNKFEHKFV